MFESNGWQEAHIFIMFDNFWIVLYRLILADSCVVSSQRRFGDSCPPPSPIARWTSHILWMITILGGIYIFLVYLVSETQMLHTDLYTRSSCWSAVMQRLSQDAKQAVVFRGRMESVEKWMSQRRLPQRLRNRIANYYAEVCHKANYFESTLCNSCKWWLKA